MAKNVYRYARSNYGRKGELLPKRLEFLVKVPFCSVIEDHQGTRMQIRVELLASTLKRLVANTQRQAEMAKPSREVVDRKDKEIEHLRKTVDELRSERNRLMDERDLALRSAESANEKLAQSNEDKLSDENRETSGPLAGYLGRADTRGFKPYGLPLPGGLPSLPKRR